MTWYFPSGTIYMENTSGGAYKFWSACFSGQNRVTLWWGRIGTQGQKLVKEFRGDFGIGACSEFVEAKVAEKLGKGYQRVSPGDAAWRPQAGRADATWRPPMAVDSKPITALIDEAVERVADNLRTSRPLSVRGVPPTMGAPGRVQPLALGGKRRISFDEEA